MNRNTDHFEDLEYIRSLFDADDIHAPDSLSEENIMAMLPDRTDEKPVQETSDYSSDITEYSSQDKPARKPVFTRTVVKHLAVTAACLIFAVFGGVQLYQTVTAPPDTGIQNGELYTFKDKSEIEHLVSSLDRSQDILYDGDVLEEAEMVTEDSAPATGSMDAGSGNMVRSEAKSSSSAGDHSDTYLQVEDVDEADIVKTDGRYIYYVSNDREVIILSADNGKTQLMSKIGAGEVENYVHDIFLKGDTLITVGYVYDGDDGYTGVTTYDISDRKKPEMITSFRQTGTIGSSRMVGNYVYLVTRDSVYKGGRVLPKCIVDGNYTEMTPDSICCVPEPELPSYIVLSAMDITSGKDSKCKSSAIFGASEEVYCNDHNLYTTATEWDDKTSSSATRIVRASLDGLKVKFNATVKVRGRIDDQFSMDEKDGYFRIATTSQRDGMDVNNLFVLDKDLKETGTLSGFARNESIRAVRYFGDKAYVITYEQIDPLFIIDLSDPENPSIDGEVKIDGFSTLLVPAGEGRLLGIGHATGDNGYGGEYAAGLKLVLFDISDPSQPKVLDSREFKDMSSPAQDTHKALTVNSRDGWYAVPYSVYNYEDEPILIEEEGPADASASETAPSEEISDELYTEPQFEAGVLVFGADDKLNIYDQHSLSENYLTRSVYIGDYIYALDEEGNVSSFRFTK